LWGEDAPLIAWRRQITRIYERLLRDGAWLAPGELSTYLLKALTTGKLGLPQQVMVVGFPTPAPAEEAWLQAVAAATRVVHLQVKGDPRAVQEAVVLPDRGQEVEWVAAEVLKSAHQDGLPWHRLAVTALEMELYAPRLRRVLAELLGPPQTEAGWNYNFSQGPPLSETPLFQAALLPLKFLAGGEAREDLISILLSPYYGLAPESQPPPAQWDRFFRDCRAEGGWQRLRAAVAQSDQATPAWEEVLARLDRAWENLRVPAATGKEWVRRLNAVWKSLSFPQNLEDGEAAPLSRLNELLQELEAALGPETLNPGEFLSWLTHGARRLTLPGPGVQEAGLQVLGLLEMRGLDFSRVWCLGMNSGVLPPPPRPLPLLSAGEKRLVLGGTYQSQHHFARELYDTLLGSAPEMVLTRPRLVEQEEQVPTPLYLGEWRPEEMSPLSRPHPAWLRSPAVAAALAGPGVAAGPALTETPITMELPGELYLTRAQIALSCPCRFLLQILLNIEELAEIEAGLPPTERGDRLHKVLARFAAEFQQILQEQDGWDQDRARKLLAATARLILKEDLPDLHWQAEWDRWLGEGDTPGLLWEWLAQEKARYEEGWRWQGQEVRFRDLKGEGWEFSLRGRLDRLDHHPGTGDLIIWDYKTGEIPTAAKVFDKVEDFQLPGYLLAVKRGRVPTPPETQNTRAGFIGLKSTREKHLKYEDFQSRAAEWDRLVAIWEERLAALGKRLKAGDFSPQPFPAPEGKNQGACQYCPYTLICGHTPEPAIEEGEEE
jgi:exodeoxyribonuclease-5